MTTKTNHNNPEPHYYYIAAEEHTQETAVYCEYYCHPCLETIPMGWYWDSVSRLTYDLISVHNGKNMGKIGHLLALAIFEDIFG